MGVQLEPNVANVFAGAAKIWLASYPATFPTLTTKPNDAAWETAGFKHVGYTEAGMDITTTVSVKEVKVDESLSPVKYIIDSIKVEAKSTLMEASLENLERVIPLSKLTNDGSGIKVLKVGSANLLQEFALGMQGPGPGGVDARVFRMFRCNVTSSATQSYKRADVSKLPATFSSLADSLQSSLDDICDTTDFNAGS